MAPLISYAQNGEDVVLDRLFRDQGYGRYVDIGASDPVVDSVTKLFYDRGWRGINVEPSPVEFALLEQDRPGDVNLCVAAGDHVGTATLYLGSAAQRGLGTLDAANARRVQGDDAVASQVPLTTLYRIVLEHVHGPVDFLKVDVEGYEAAVIAGADWGTFHPRVVVVEATAPNSTLPTHARWEPVLLQAGYVPALFDGLNRFYVDREDLEARILLAAPANVHDAFVRADLDSTSRRALELQERCADLERECEALRRRVELLGLADRIVAQRDQTPDWYGRDWDDDRDPFLEVAATAPDDTGGAR